MDKFVWAMAAMAVLLAIAIGGGFVATGYIKKHPEIFEANPQPK